MLKPNQYLKIRNIYIFLLALTWFAYAYSRGVRTSPDSGRYSLWAETLIKLDFNIFQFAQNIDFTFPPYFYYNWITILAFSKLLAGDSWGLGIVALNLSVAVFVGTLLFKTAWTITGKPACAIFAGLLLLFSHDFFLWIPFPLSDILFSSICFVIFILITNLYQQPSKYLKRVVGIMILLCYTMFFRPTWPPLLIFAILSIPLIFFFRLKTADSNERHNFIIRCALLACIFIPLIIFCHSYFMQHPDNWPFPFLGKLVSFLAKDYQQGIVIWQHPETYHSPPGHILEYAFISLHKIFAFFYISVDSYSFRHSLMNYIFFLPIYGLSIWAVIQLFKKENGPSSSNWWNIFSCALFIFLFAFFHSLEQIDFDFRYRLPCILPLIFLATLGLNELINDFSKRT